jgi:hypothetical protein
MMRGTSTNGPSGLDGKMIDFKGVHYPESVILAKRSIGVNHATPKVSIASDPLFHF